MSISLPRETIDYRINLIDQYGGNLADAARASGIPRTTLQSTLDAARRVGVESPRLDGRILRPVEAPGRLDFVIENGVVLIASDAHFWPGEPSCAYRGFVEFCKGLRPKAVIMNGDMLDGATISRHPPIGWESRPTLVQELEVCKERLDGITVAAGDARRLWPLGNHDARLETRIATVAPEFARVHGVHLSDHFPDYEKCWSCFINNTVVVKHRAKGGIHATHNNVLNAGLSIVTGHLHSLKVTPFSDYRDAARWGVDSGTLADPYGAHTAYMEDGFRNHRTGFVVLTFRNYELLWPELVWARNQNEVEFRGEVFRV